MKAKGLIRFFVIAFALVCLYQLSFTLVTSRVEKKAKAYAKGDAALERRYLDSLSDVTVYNLLIRKFTYQQAKEQQLNLGLDLQGGMNVVMEVSVADVIRALSNFSKDATFNKALELAAQRQANSQLDFVTLFEQSFTELDPNGKLAAIFATRENQGKIDYNSSNAQVMEVIRTETEGAIDRSFNILRTRIDKFGVTSPNIQRQQGTGRIIIELPGVDNPERVRRLLQGSAKLEFWETYESAEILERLFEVNKMLGDRNKLKGGADSTSKATTAAAAADTSKKQDDLLSQIAEKESTDTSAGGLDQAKAQAENPLFAVLMPAVFQAEDGSTRAADGPAVGSASIRDTAKVNAYLNMPEVKSMLPRNLRLLWTVKGRGDGNKFLDLVAIKARANDSRAPLEGDVITDARESIDNFGQVEVSMTMNAEGAKTWRRLTADNIERSIAIVLDDYVYSYPNVKSEISGGMSSISGNFTPDEAKDLANILKAGKLPAPARIVEEAIVGPSLGAEAIRSGVISMVAGLMLVVMFMIAYYGSGGIIANVALLANIFFIFGVLASLQAVLTLPGIAGIVLTIGMSVDANVLIFERIREEMRKGKSLRQGIIDGFNHAYSSIIDANVTTILVGIILYSFGTGPIRGFATTLIIGILTSLFSAIFITRMLIDWQVAREKVVTFSTNWSERIFANISVNFLARRKLWYAFSLTVIVAGLISMFTVGFNLGVDFKGGRSYVVQFDEAKRSIDIRTALTSYLGGAPEVKTFGAADKFKITTSYKIDENTPEVDLEVEQKLHEGLSTLMASKIDFDKFKESRILSSQKVGPTIADDIKASAIMSIIISILVIAAYILIRFRKIEYSLGAAASLLHDVLFVLSAFTLLWKVMPFSMEIDQAFIAAILTIIGYSINDTVVVFDRLREFLGLHHGGDNENVINGAINSTLSRTINTALTTIIVVLILFLFGGEVIRGFTFALLIGLIIGTYSSIFIASAVVLDSGKLLAKKK
jgi:SecD/SecF fusion protein